MVQVQVPKFYGLPCISSQDPTAGHRDWTSSDTISTVTERGGAARLTAVVYYLLFGDCRYNDLFALRAKVRNQSKYDSVLATRSWKRIHKCIITWHPPPIPLPSCAATFLARPLFQQPFERSPTQQIRKYSCVLILSSRQYFSYTHSLRVDNELFIAHL